MIVLVFFKNALEEIFDQNLEGEKKKMLKIVKKLGGIIIGNNQKDIVSSYEEILSENVEELSKNEDFFNLPLKKVFYRSPKKTFRSTGSYDQLFDLKICI